MNLDDLSDLKPKSNDLFNPNMEVLNFNLIISYLSSRVI